MDNIEDVICLQLKRPNFHVWIKKCLMFILCVTFCDCNDKQINKFHNYNDIFWIFLQLQTIIAKQ
jgi:hypothetical protein